MRTGMIMALVCAAGLAVAPLARADSVERRQPVVQKAETPAHANAMIEKAIAYLRTQQDAKTGGWCIQEGAPVFPAITGLVLQGMLAQPGISEDDAAVQAGVKFLLNSQQPDGGIYVGMLPSYNTAICLTALSTVNSPAQVADAREKALAFLRTIQYGEAAVAHDKLSESAQAVAKDNPFYGGFGYGRHGRPDMSNTTFAVEAMHAMNLPDNDPAYERVITFLQRCQMQEKAGGVDVNDLAYAKGSRQGGFIYSTSVNKDKVGIGQSPAGEIAESLDSRSGASAQVRLKQVDGKALTLTRDEVAARIKRIWDREPDLSRGIIAQEYQVLLGPTSDGVVASSFEVRASIAPDRLASVLAEALATEIDGAAAVTAKAEQHWQGLVRHRAYGTMTYAGLKSYLYAGLSKTDPRVLAAREWISRNYTLDVNPGSLETDGLYYYYLMFARTYDALGEPVVPVVTKDGTEQRDWAKDLISQLATLQNEDGSFRSVDDRWMENNPVLITAYSLIALQCAAR